MNLHSMNIFSIAAVVACLLLPPLGSASPPIIVEDLPSPGVCAWVCAVNLAGPCQETAGNPPVVCKYAGSCSPATAWIVEVTVTAGSGSVTGGLDCEGLSVASCTAEGPGGTDSCRGTPSTTGAAYCWASASQASGHVACTDPLNPEPILVDIVEWLGNESTA